MSGTGTLRLAPVLEHLEAVAPVVGEFLLSWPHAKTVEVAEIDPDLADTAALCEGYDVEPDFCANCVVVAGARAGETKLAACVVLATTRADVNNIVRRRLDARKASFAAMEAAVDTTGMEYGAITPVGLPPDMPILVDPAVAAAELVIVGSGVRGSKLVMAGSVLAELPGVEIVEGLGRPA